MTNSGTYGVTGAGFVCAGGFWAGVTGAGFVCAGFAAGRGACATSGEGAAARASRKRIVTFFSMLIPTLFGYPGDRDTELACLSVEIRTLDAERLSGVAHPPGVMLKDRRDVIALEAEAGFAQIAGRHEPRGCPLEMQRGQYVLHLDV